MPRGRTHFVGWGLAAAMLAALPAAAAPLSFEDAAALLLSRSDALEGARAAVDSRRATANSTDYLDYPRVEIDAKALASEKTLDVDLTGVKSLAESMLPALNSTTGSYVASLLPSSAVMGVHNSGVRGTVTASLPLYTGGKIDATQKAAAAGVRQADAELTLTEQTLRTQLAQVYFLYQLALRVRDVRLEVRDGLKLHLQNAKRAEAVGVVPHAQVLQAQVASDEAVRNLAQAEADVRNTGAALSNLLHLPAAPEVSTPLFVTTGKLPPLKAFLAAAQKNHGQIARLAALDDAAGEAVRIEESARLPQVYAFGEYNLTGRGLAGKDYDLTTPDWAFGLGVRYELFSGIDRSEAEQAAVKKQAQVQAMIRQTRIDLTTAVTRAYNDVEAARERFVLLESDLASARENVRIQDESFREGFATSVDAVDARLALSRALVGRAEAAFRFDEALARLLFASGEAERLAFYIANADQVIAK